MIATAWADVLSLAGDGGGGAGWRLLAVAASIFAAAILRGFTGFGFALAAVPLLGLFIPPSRAVPLAIGLQLCGGLVDFSGAKSLCHWPSLRRLMAGALLGTPIGAAALTAASPTLARICIAAICAGGTFILARGFSFRRLPGAASTVAVGLAAGLFNGLAAAPGPPVVAYYLAAPLGAGPARASLLVFFLATSIIGAVSLGIAGLLGPGLVVTTLVGLPLMVVGSWLGKVLFGRAGGRGHRAVSVGILAAVAALSGVKALLDLV